MSILSSEDIIRAVGGVIEPHHDTLYCTGDVKNKLKQSMSSGIGSTRMVDSVKIHGLDVVEVPYPTNESSVAIVCEKGEVFPTTKDYK